MQEHSFSCDEMKNNAKKSESFIAGVYFLKLIALDWLFKPCFCRLFYFLSDLATVRQRGKVGV